MTLNFLFGCLVVWSKQHIAWKPFKSYEIKVLNLKASRSHELIIRMSRLQNPVFHVFGCLGKSETVDQHEFTQKKIIIVWIPPGPINKGLKQLSQRI